MHCLALRPVISSIIFKVSDTVMPGITRMSIIFLPGLCAWHTFREISPSAIVVAGGEPSDSVELWSARAGNAAKSEALAMGRRAGVFGCWMFRANSQGLHYEGTAYALMLAALTGGAGPETKSSISPTPVIQPPLDVEVALMRSHWPFVSTASTSCDEQQRRMWVGGGGGDGGGTRGTVRMREGRNITQTMEKAYAGID